MLAIKIKNFGYISSENFIGAINKIKTHMWRIQVIINPDALLLKDNL